MNLDRQVALLRETVSGVGQWDFRQLQDLHAGPWTDERHEPSHDGKLELVQMEAEVLQVFEDGAIQVHVTVYAPERILCAEMVAASNGHAEWDGDIHELVAGVPVKLNT